MSANPDHTASDVSCRILVLSSRISQARSCITRIQSRGKRQSSPPLDITSDASTLPKSSGSSEGLIKIPWTITNKYYSALVHFAAHRMHGLSPHQVQNIPAIIFVWSQGESYKHHIERIMQDLSGYEPEVCLAVRLAPQASSRPPSPLSDEEGHDDVEIDGFLSSHGFEFIDAIEKDGETLEGDTWSSSEIPGIERVLDALSTVMWPSMTTTSKLDIQKRDRERALLDWAITSQDHSLSAVEEITAKSGAQISARTKAMKQEMEELAQWLEEDHTYQDDPWISAVSTGGLSMTPGVMDHCGKATEVNFGFDDDFTVFVSAPAVDPIEISGRSTPDVDTDGLLPTGPYAGHLYRALGSVSDLGGSEDGKDAASSNIDDELPSKEEILATSSRIFGTSKLPLPPVTEIGMNPAKVSKTSEIHSSMTAAAKTLSDDDLDAFAPENSGTDGGGSYDMEHFDLSKVLGALQEMKAEIANMEDESERRRAAARVALGLVYGLEADAE